MKAAKQTPIRTHAVSQDIGVSAVVLGSSDTKSITQAIELFRIDRMYHQPSID